MRGMDEDRLERLDAYWRAANYLTEVDGLPMTAHVEDMPEVRDWTWVE